MARLTVHASRSPLRPERWSEAGMWRSSRSSPPRSWCANEMFAARSTKVPGAVANATTVLGLFRPTTGSDSCTEV